MFLEPYACAIKLVEEGLYLVNDLAGTIDVSRLVADKSAIPSPKDSFWPDWLTDPKTRRWIRLLG